MDYRALCKRLIAELRATRAQLADAYALLDDIEERAAHRVAQAEEAARQYEARARHYEAREYELQAEAERQRERERELEYQVHRLRRQRAEEMWGG